jgi:hypothetical protein
MIEESEIWFVTSDLFRGVVAKPFSVVQKTKVFYTFKDYSSPAGRRIHVDRVGSYDVERGFASGLTKSAAIGAFMAHHEAEANNHAGLVTQALGMLEVVE